MATPQELTEQVLDVSVTERVQFRSCRRRWDLQTIRNLEPKAPAFPLLFGSGMHRALEVLSSGGSLVEAETELEAWYGETDAQLEKDGATAEELDELLEHHVLGRAMLENYEDWDAAAPIQLGKPLAVEGHILKGATPPGKKSKLTKARPAGYPDKADVRLHEDSRRLLVPIVEPDSKKPTGAHLSARIDLVTERKTPRKGLWVWDRKTGGASYISALGRALEHDDQLTGYCYVVWRWLGIIPRGAGFDCLVKQAPKEPRLLQSGDLSTAKDQLTTAALYREALIEKGYMSERGKFLADSEKHQDCYEGLLARGFDPFFKRYEALRSEAELRHFEERLYEEWGEMREVREGSMTAYPNMSTFQCSNCSVASICRAMEQDSDPDSIIAMDFRVGEDRKAVR